MPKTAVQTPICDICGADVREGSLFCYNCGGSLKQVAMEKPERLPEPVPAPSPRPNGSGKPVAVEQRPPRRKRNIDRGPVQVVWEPREGISVVFVIACVFLLLIALVLFIAAMWLK
jgi:hypothetical protein